MYRLEQSGCLGDRGRPKAGADDGEIVQTMVAVQLLYVSSDHLRLPANQLNPNEGQMLWIIMYHVKLKIL